MRIGIDARFIGFNYSGLARYSESLIEAIAHADTRNEYIVFVHANLEHRLRLGPNFQLFEIRGRPLGLASMRRMKRVLRREKPDLLHVLFPLSDFGIDTPTLLTVHDTLPFQREGVFFNWRFPLSRWLYLYLLYPLSLRRSKWILCVSQSTRDALGRLFPELYHKTIVLYSGVDEIFRQPMEPATMELIRTRLKLPPRYILYSGSTRADKNIQGVLSVLATLRQRNAAMADLHLVMEVSGDPQMMEAIRKAIRQFGLDAYVDILHDMNDEERRLIFADAQALVLLGRSEGFGFPILEAQLSGIPVVAADSGALPEIAGEQGAMLVDPDNLDDSVTVLERVLASEDLRNYLVAGGRKNAEKFNWHRTAAEVLQIYELLFYPRDQVSLPRDRPLATRIIEWLAS